MKATHTQLLALGQVVGIAIEVTLSREESVDRILLAMGYHPSPKNTRVEVAPVSHPVFTLEEVHHMLNTYVMDEVSLLRATASMLETLHNLKHPTKQYAKEVKGELSRYHGHTNLPRILGLMRMLFPDAQF